MSITKKYQVQLLEQARTTYRETPITPETERAYIETPRHVFVSRYRQWGSTTWHDVELDNSDEHAAAL